MNICRGSGFLAGLAAVLLLSSCASNDRKSERKKLLRGLYASTLQIVVSQPDGVRRTGSGVVLRVDAVTGDVDVITAAHVLPQADDHEVMVVGKFRRNTYTASVLVRDDEEDIAVLRTGGIDVRPVTVGGDAELGQDIWVVSYPWGRRRTLVTGIVSQIDWPETMQGRREVPLSGPVRLIDAAAAYGTSGGGVFDAESGNLLGIVRGYRTISIPLPGKDAKPLSLPIAGETTVVPVAKIRKFLEARGLGDILPAPGVPPTRASRDDRRE